MKKVPYINGFSLNSNDFQKHGPYLTISKKSEQKSLYKNSAPPSKPSKHTPAKSIDLSPIFVQPPNSKPPLTQYFSNKAECKGNNKQENEKQEKIIDNKRLYHEMVIEMIKKRKENNKNNLIASAPSQKTQNIQNEHLKISQTQNCITQFSAELIEPPDNRLKMAHSPICKKYSIKSEQGKKQNFMSLTTSPKLKKEKDTKKNSEISNNKQIMVHLRNELWAHEKNQKIKDKQIKTQELATEGCTFYPMISSTQYQHNSIYKEYRKNISPQISKNDSNILKNSNSYVKINEVISKVKNEISPTRNINKF